MGNNLVLYRTFILSGRLDRLVDSQPVDPQDYVIQ
jgi:hypothetical protein